MEVLNFGGPGGRGGGPGGGPGRGHWGPPPPRPPMGGGCFRRRPYGYGGCFPGGCGCFTLAILAALLALGSIIFFI